MSVEPFASAELSPNRSWRLFGPGGFEEIELTDQSLNPEEVRIGFRYCGICGSDVSTFEGRRNTDFPVSLGHEFVAVVEAVGSDVTKLDVGDVVVSDLNFRCGLCKPCLSSKSHLCVESQKGSFSNRGFSTRAHILPNYLTRIPRGEVDSRYCLAEPLSCVIHAFQHAAIMADDRVLVLGAGGLGLCAALIAEDRGIEIDVWDLNERRLTALSDAVSMINSRKPEVGEYDVVLDLTGSVSGLELACKSVVKGGRLISMSHLDGYGPIEFLLPALTRRDVWFIVSYLNGEKANLSAAVEILQRIWSKNLDPLIHIAPIEDLPSLFERRRDSSFSKFIVDLSNWVTPNDGFDS